MPDASEFYMTAQRYCDDTGDQNADTPITRRDLAGWLIQIVRAVRETELRVCDTELNILRCEKSVYETLLKIQQVVRK